MVRGYISSELEQRIIKSGNHFLIKDRKYCAGTILKAFSETGESLTDCKLNKSNKIIDMHVNETYLALDVSRKFGKEFITTRIISSKCVDRNNK